ncbi:hypothetical protein TraAM80_06231 [Trypanosoma rangeli]|uniref:C2 domain-containing protein n=1 Tax=Trypanosoma rangeli TaxID=5698 RepID=A0A422NBB7_TRYRA|nr:uncharacterized protein TraAM80_06231 [Trypanosoma rangeli]RNF02780.1 hypothetical protein TraAM80_06231 [Trypanosoma rangeli]|eukprot:RNF02780.1 hypothetical protein TraAM80_06231 [Trypanosoma rangeli]
MSFGSGIQQGRITLTVHRAESLVALNNDGSSNPYVTATIGKQSQATAVVRGTTNPSFDSILTFTACPLPTILTLRVLNKAMYGETEELLGSATLTLFSALPMTRRTLPLGHGGNVALSQKARDGCGSLDISYEVAIMTPGELAAQTQQHVANDDLPAFLREDNGAGKLTSAYAAVGKEEFTSAPVLSTQPVFPTSSNGPLEVPQVSQPQRPVQPVPTQPPQPPSMPAATQPLPPPLQQPGVVNPVNEILGVVATQPPSHNSSELVTPHNPVVIASLPPSNMVPLQQLPTTPSFSVARSMELPKAPAFSSAQYPIAATTPHISSGPSLHVMQPVVHTASSLDDPGNAQQVGTASGVVEGGDTSLQVPPPPSQLAVRFTPVATSPSVNGSLTPNSTFASSSTTTTSCPRPQQQPSAQIQQQELLNSLPLAVTAGVTPPPPAPAPLTSPLNYVAGAGVAPAAAPTNTTAAERNNDKPKKKVTVMTYAREECTGSTAAAAATTATTTNTPAAKRAAVKAAPLANRGVHHTAVIPVRETRRSVSLNGPRSSSRGRAQTQAATPGIAHTSPGLYQWPEELLAAAAEGNTALFQKLRDDDPLLSRGFENVRDYSGRTILHIAAWYGHTDILKALLQASPSVPMIELRALRSHNGNTILHSAAQGGRADVVQWLRFGHPATGLLMGLRNVHGFTATDCAREAGFTDVAVMLDES